MALRAAPPPPLANSSFRQHSALLSLRPPTNPSNAVSRSLPVPMGKRVGGRFAAAPFFRFSPTSSLCVRKFNRQVIATAMASRSGISSSSGVGEDVNAILEGWKEEISSPRNPFLAKLAIALGVAATVTLLSVCFKQSAGSNLRLPFVMDGSSQSFPVGTPAGFTLTLFGYKIIIPEYTPGWVYFWLLMAAGCGLFISEEALNVWVGISLARNLTLDGNWQSFAESFSKNAPYVISTILWVYWGVCISDMIPFYLGKLFRKTKASEDICTKLGIGKEKAVSITRVVRKYGNLIGFVERFSLGVRNPTSFLAGAWGISSEYFFVGVCCGGLITLPVQLAIGFLLRERPVVALASVATVVRCFYSFDSVAPVNTELIDRFKRNPSHIVVSLVDANVTGPF